MSYVCSSELGAVQNDNVLWQETLHVAQPYRISTAVQALNAWLHIESRSKWSLVNKPDCIGSVLCTE